MHWFKSRAMLSSVRKPRESSLRPGPPGASRSQPLVAEAPSWSSGRLSRNRRACPQETRVLLNNDRQA